MQALFEMPTSQPNLPYLLQFLLDYYLAQPFFVETKGQCCDTLHGFITEKLAKFFISMLCNVVLHHSHFGMMQNNVAKHYSETISLSFAKSDRNYIKKEVLFIEFRHRCINRIPTFHKTMPIFVC